MNMQNSSEIKEMVRQKYAAIATQEKEVNESSCCGSGCCSDEVYNIMTDDYSEMKGYNADADLGLGCGLPTQFAKIKKGDVVVDLGSGAGNDCFIARAETGETGKVIGIDFTLAMIEKARANVEKLKYNNVEFRQGDIENIPVADNTADVVVSNCVLNLVPDKDKAVSEIYRILKPGGHFSISDIVLIGNLPEKIRNAAEMYAGCVSGALQKNVYLEIIQNNNLENTIILPDDILSNHLSQEDINQFKQSGAGIYSITVYADKPLKEKSCCSDDCCK
jgi:ubiquinone/menaquinone biosynthesis C-methylase UbiE